MDSKKAQKILVKITTIQKMERGKICQMTGRSYYNHQTWQNGRNVVKYVPTDEVSELKEAIEGYELFTQLMEQYAEEVIRLTRNQRRKKKRKRRETIKSQKKGI